MIILYATLIIIAYDLCGLLAILYFTSKGEFCDHNAFSSAFVIVIFWPILCTARIGIALYRIVRRRIK